MTAASARFALPYLLAGQGQKDVTHNEAVSLMDFLVHPVVTTRALSSPPPSPAAGEAWLIGANADGAWFGRDGQVACHTVGGWRFLPVVLGMQIWVTDEARTIRYTGAQWTLVAPYNTPAADVDLPVGGTVVDVEARAAIAAILERLHVTGLVG